MNKYWDIRYLKIALYTILVVIISIFVYRISSNTDNILPSLYQSFKDFMSIFSPVLYGLLIAYLMNPIMAFIEGRMIASARPTKATHYRRIRILSLLIVNLSLFVTLFFVVKFLIPEIVSNIEMLFNNSQSYLTAFVTTLNNLQQSINENIHSPELLALTNQLLDPSTITDLFKSASLKDLFNHIVSSAMSFTGTLFNLIIGFVIAIYALLQKETFQNGCTRLVHAIFRPSIAQRILTISSESHQMITKFFVGKFLDSLIIGVLCFIGLSLLSNPYALLLALIIGVCNMIPYFGPFIGAIPAIILTLFEGPRDALWVALFILGLQQFDGLVLGPKILGDSIGITPFWIISAVTVGGAIWGPLGMFFASPLLAVILSTVNAWIDKKLNDKSVHLPKLEYENAVPAPSSHPSFKVSKKPSKDLHASSKKKP